MNNSDKIILDLCGGTGSWSKPYLKNGYDVRIIDVNEWTSEDGDDVRLFQKPKESIYGILSAPPCTHFAVSGARHWKKKGTKPLLDGLSVVDACLRIVTATNPKFWVLENPVGRLRHYIGKPKATFHPCFYGDAYTKRTCLWGNFNMPNPTDIVDPEFVEWKSKKGEIKRMSKIFYESFKLPKNERSKIRSKTPTGFANAFYESNQ